MSPVLEKAKNLSSASAPLLPAVEEPRLSLSSEPQPGDTSCTSDLCGLPTSSDPLLPEAQRRWAARPLTQRLEILRVARHWIAENTTLFADAMSPELARGKADTLTAEVLPLVEAMRFLERNAVRLLAPEKLGRRGRPVWLAGVTAEIQHVPLGHILVIGPGNFPLFLPGVQALQALVAGNAVTWKPGRGGEPVARLLAHVLREAGLPRGVLRVTDDSVEAAEGVLAQHPDKVVFTGSFATGKKLLRTLAETATPSILELSGSDAVVVLPSADLPLVAQAVSFGLRLNGGEVCMSPRRLVATRDTLNTLRPLLQAELDKVPAVSLKSHTAAQLAALLPAGFADPRLDFERQTIRPLLLDHGAPGAPLTCEDLFAPVLTLLEAPSVLHLAEIVNNNPYGLTAAIFGDPHEAQALAAELQVGTVVINDLIAPTADPRLPFGGRGRSGFGVTRGAEGLLALTATRTVLRRSKGLARHYAPLGPSDFPFFSSLIAVLHGGSWRARWNALRTLVTSARAKMR